VAAKENWQNDKISGGFFYQYKKAYIQKQLADHGDIVYIGYTWHGIIA